LVHSILMANPKAPMRPVELPEHVNGESEWYQRVGLEQLDQLGVNE